MLMNQKLTAKEKTIAKRIHAYFKPNDMNFREKLFAARLIALHELESQQFDNQAEMHSIVEFNTVLESIMTKISLDLI